MKKIITLLAITFVIHTNAQNTLTLQPDGITGKDALLHGLSSEVNTNWGNVSQFPADAWTFSGTPGVVRSIVEFDLSSIPSTATITSAQLSLFAWDSTSGFGQHSPLSGPNDCVLQRITSGWNESTVTWNTQPTTTTQNSVALAASTGPTEDYTNIDVTLLVQDMVNNPTTSFGFMLSLQNENYYRRMNFCSSDHSIPALRPMLNVNYSTPAAIQKLQHTDILVNIYPNPNKGNFNIETNATEKQTMQLHDINGKLVLSQIINGTTNIDASALNEGVYNLSIIGNEGLVNKRLVIVK